MNYQLFWGDSHLNLHSRHRPRLEECFKAARAHLDFLPIAYYPMDFYTTKEGLRVESWHNRGQFIEEWKEIQELCRKYHEPGASSHLQAMNGTGTVPVGETTTFSTLTRTTRLMIRTISTTFMPT